MKTVVVLFLHLICGVVSQWDPTVCTAVQQTFNTPVQRPRLSSQFEAHVECTMTDQRTSVEIHEFYDYDDDKGAIHILQNGILFYVYYSYKTNEIIFIEPKTKSCVVRELSQSRDKFIFGYTKGTGHIFTASGALYFTAKQKYSGTGVARGVYCNTWYSCQYWPPMDATMNVTWYFTHPLNWDTSLMLKNVPVRAHVKGRVNGNNPHDFEHIYDIIQYKPFIQHMKDFETPSGVSCPGRKNTKAFPKLADAFSFNIEIVDNVQQQVSFMREWYDMNMGLVQFMYKPSPQTSSPFGNRPLKEIHDFNTGVAYIMDPMVGNCTVRSIEPGSFDDKSVDPHHVRIKNAREFFYTDVSSVTYEGVKKLRQMDSDVWVGQRTNFPSGFNSTWQWYFKTADWKASQDRMAEFRGGTLQMLTFAISSRPIDFSYNIYNFVQARPDIVSFDISACYQTGNRRKFDFTLPGQFRYLVEKNIKLFKYSTLRSLVGFCAVSPLRIAHLKIVFGKDIHIRFEMLDKAPMKGDVYTNTTETKLDMAAAFFIQTVNLHKFAIMLDYDPTLRTQYVLATPNSIREFQYEEELEKATGYSPGVLGGMATGMVVGGGGLGALLAFLFFK